ncbi:MAG TPA: septum formation initiator family protein [Gemmatimonadales bacterium]|nr:septum formation initiator family protein [Gemmatimonadales bacterium]
MNRRVVVGTVVVGMVAFAAMGGEYSSLDLWRMRRQVRREQAAIVRLRRDVDSLTRAARALKTDSATLERVARETFGMIRPGESLYEVVPPDSARP